MIESEELNILIETGADFVMFRTIRDDQENPVDLTGSTIVSHLREFAEAADCFEFTCLHNEAGGRITISMPHEITSQIAFAKGVYDVKVTLADGFTTYTIHGDAFVRHGVTKPDDGTALYMIGIGEYDNLPEVGSPDRLYFVFEDRKVYRWNGTNYVATAVGNGIQSIAKVGTAGLIDIYRITYDDGTSFDYMVVNGKGVSSVTHVDGGTYRMNFNDGTYVDFDSVPRVLGAYDATADYEKLDIVHGTDGATYIAKLPVPAGTALSNATYWQQMTPKGLAIGTITEVGPGGATASIGGTADAPMLNLSIPRGVAGDSSINDTKGEGDTDYVFSADKGSNINSGLVISDRILYDGHYEITSGDLESGYWGYSVKYANTKRLRIKYLIPVCKGMCIRYKNPTMKIYLAILSKLNGITYPYNNGTGWLTASANYRNYWCALDGYLVICLESEDNITPTDYDCDIAINAPYITEPKYKWESHGVKELDLRWPNRGRNYHYPDPWATVYSTSGNICSELYKIPEDGLYVYSDNLAWDAQFWTTDNNGNIVAAEDYAEYVFINNGDFNSYNVGQYIPYAENIYVNFYILYGNSRNNTPEYLHIITGHITDNGGRLPNLQPASIGGWSENNCLVISPSYYWLKINENAEWQETFSWYSSCYCSILRLQDITEIVAAPPYALVARIYKVDHKTKTASVYEEIIGGFTYIHSEIDREFFGQSRIDFRKYDFEGFAVVGVIQGKYPYKYGSGGGSKWYYNKHLGLLNDYESVYNSVYVQWRSGVQVTYDSGMSSVVQNNIKRILKNNFIPSVPKLQSDAGYGNWNMFNEKWNFYGLYNTYIDQNAKGWWYSGSNLHNAPYMHVTPKSFITASKNPHSRVYVPVHPDLDYYNNLYGTVCSSTSSLIHGLPTGNETMTVCSHLSSDIHEYKDYTCIEDLHPGDLFANCQDHDFTVPGDKDASSFGHIVTITEVVSINGEVFCVNAFEGSQPFTRFRTYINYDAYKGYATNKIEGREGEADLFDFYSSRYFDNAVHPTIARVKRQYIKTFLEAYGENEADDYSVTSIMCDRGTDSIYGIGEYMTLFVKDGTTTITLGYNSTLRSVDLTEYPSVTYEDGVVYNVTGMVTASGYHSIYVDSDLKESFYVAPYRTFTSAVDNVQKKWTLTFDQSEEDDEVVAVGFLYANFTMDKYPRPTYYLIDPNTEGNEQGKIEITVDSELDWCDGVTRTPYLSGTCILRRTPYGTYKVYQSKVRSGIN